MKRFLLGFRALIRSWTDASFAEAATKLLSPRGEAADEPAPTPTRSDALTLLAVLQREARLIDFIQEPIASYADAQIGAAVRDVHSGCKAVFDRLLDLQPLAAESEGSQITVPADANPERYRLVGNVTGTPPHQGQLTHHGWRATRCDIPKWTGDADAALNVAPAEVELQ
jgi:hypothetical protein